MRTRFSLPELARDLAKLASETRDPDTASELIALTEELLIAAGHLPGADGDGPNEGNGGGR